MQVSYNWLLDYIDMDLSPADLAKALTGRGVVVETLTYRNPGVSGVLVGKVVAIERHPNADTLWVCQVDVGTERLQILTAAQNVHLGDMVPAAVPGAKLPGKSLAVATLRGMESSGMLCSATELGIDEGSDGIMILPNDPDLAPGQDAADVLGLNDWIMELDLTANYASHCQSMLGVAQEVAAILGIEMRAPETYTEATPGTDIARQITIRIDEPDLCSRYTARLVRGVTVGQSPAWMQARLRAAGMRPINNIVDISNFVMLELGQPLHTFDHAKVGGKQIIVRRAAMGEEIVTLDKQKRTLDSDVLVIADRNGPIAMAGVMGGLDSEVTEATTDILIESAAFYNINNRRTALRMNLPSEAARRYTKGVDPSGCVRAADRAAGLIADLAGGRVAQGHIDLYPRPVAPCVLILRTAKVNQLLGLCLSTERMVAHLTNFGLKVLTPTELAFDLATGIPEEEEIGSDLGGRLVWTAMHQVSPVPMDDMAYATWGDRAWANLEQAGERLEAIGEQEALVVVVPTRRLDISIEVDLIEEIARAESYDNIPTVLPVLASSRGGRSPLAQKVLEARLAMAGAGLDEVMTHALTSPKVYEKLGLTDVQLITIANPMYEERSSLRISLLPGLLDVLQHNLNRRVADLGIFEISHVYLPKEGQQLPEEPLQVAIALMGNMAQIGWNTPAQPADFFLLKGYVEELLKALNVSGGSFTPSAHPALHPGRQANLVVNGRRVGVLGEVHPATQAAWDLPGRAYVAELSFEPLAEAGRPLREYRPVPRFPAVSRDVALVIGQEVPAAQVAAAIAQAGGELVQDVTLFDLYEGEHVKPGGRSLAYRITYRAVDRTLTDADIDPVHGQVRQALQALGADLRS